MRTLRYFPESQSIPRSCYALRPVAKSNSYLIRASFLYGNYDNQSNPPTFDLYFDANLWDTVNSESSSHEVIMTASRNSIDVCLVSTGKGTPFISTLELRPLDSGMYSEALSRGVALILRTRVNYGAASLDSIRYPKDRYDRIWKADTAQSVETSNPLTTTEPDYPPSAVLMTARQSEGHSADLSLGPFPLSAVRKPHYIALYFAEILQNASVGDRVFDVDFSDCCSLPGPWDNVDIAARNGGALRAFEDFSPYYNTTQDLVMNLSPTNSTKLPPIVNALEILQHSEALVAGTDVIDAEAIGEIQNSLGLGNWTGDPCEPVKLQYDWVQCDVSADPRRVTALILSSMGLAGELPSAIGKLTELLHISLDYNLFTGSIPDLSSLTKLQSLHLQHNNMTGSIPEYLGRLRHLEELFLQDNSLSGTIPLALLQDTSLNFQYFGNPYLCQPGNNSCSPSSKGNGALKIGLIIGGVLMLVLLVTAMFIISLAFLRSHRSHTSKLKKDETGQSVRCFTYDDIKAATADFSKKIGEGAFGPVFYGVLSDGQTVAVKVLSATTNQGMRQFSTEVSLLQKVHHRNLVSLIGYCTELEIVLVYEYMCKGNLQQHLYGPSSSSCHLTWRSRLCIALDAAQGLEYLHVGCSPSIVHRDVKSSNVLLDEKMRAKVADFGLSKVKATDSLTHMSTVVMGTVGYLDPEYFSTNMLSESSDVYSFGVLLLEIISGRPPLDKSHPTDQCKITDWARPFIQDGNIKQILDPRLEDSYNLEAVKIVAWNAFLCTELQARKRPTMIKIVHELRAAVELEMGQPLSFSDMPTDIESGQSSDLYSSVSAR